MQGEKKCFLHVCTSKHLGTDADKETTNECFPIIITEKQTNILLKNAFKDKSALHAYLCNEHVVFCGVPYKNLSRLAYISAIHHAV